MMNTTALWLAQDDRARDLKREIDRLEAEFDRLTSQEDRLTMRIPGNTATSEVLTPDELRAVLPLLDADIAVAERAEDDIHVRLEREKDELPGDDSDESLAAFELLVDEQERIRDEVLGPIGLRWDESDSDVLKRYRRLIEKIADEWERNLAEQDRLGERLEEIENELLTL